MPALLFNRLVAEQSTSTTFFVGYRIDAKKAHLSCAIYLKNRLGHFFSATALWMPSHPPAPCPLPPFPPRTPRVGTTIGWDIFCRLARRTAGLVCVLGSRYSGACGSSRAPRMVLPGIYGFRGRYLVIIRILVRWVRLRFFAFFWLRI